FKAIISQRKRGIAAVSITDTTSTKKLIVELMVIFEALINGCMGLVIKSANAYLLIAFYSKWVVSVFFSGLVLFRFTALHVAPGKRRTEVQSVEGENNHQYRRRVGAITTELEETNKETLEKAKEDDTRMAYYLASLKQELDETKFELKLLKYR
ncbi:hypothetical protein Tco_0026470, partial [Tanacetum coccineum]